METAAMRCDGREGDSYAHAFEVIVPSVRQELLHLSPAEEYGGYVDIIERKSTGIAGTDL